LHPPLPLPARLRHMLLYTTVHMDAEAFGPGQKG